MPPAPAIADSLPRRLARWVLAAAFAAAGALHLVAPEPFLTITPDWVPQAETVIQLTGVAEILGALGLQVPRYRRAAGIGLALYAVCVYPANIKHMTDFADSGGDAAGWLYHGPRLLFQPVIVWWALWAGRVIDWPFAQDDSTRSMSSSERPK